MSEQSEFEKWAKEFYRANDMPFKLNGVEYIMPEYQASWEGWQACNDRKDKELAEMEESRQALIKKIDSLSAHETCACSYDKEDDICLHHSPKLVEKDKEIAALRGFAQAVCKYETWHRIVSFANDCGLVDENGNPTPLLTGERE